MKDLIKWNNWLLCHTLSKVPVTVTKYWIEKTLKKYPNYFENDELILDKKDWLEYAEYNDSYTGDLVNSGATNKFSTTWLSYKQVEKLQRNSKALFPIDVEKHLGIGFVITKECPYTVIDFDRKNEEECKEEVKEYQNEWIKKFDSYTERSFSGNGYHVIIKGKIDATKYPNLTNTGASGIRSGKNSYEYAKGFEVYSQDRFITVTNDVVENKNTIQERQELLDELCLILKKPINEQIKQDDINYEIDLSLEEEQSKINSYIWEVSESNFSSKFLALLNNQINFDYDNNADKARFNEDFKFTYPSQSEADCCFVGLAYKLTQDVNDTMTLFKISGLSERKKATRTDYLNSLIMKAKENHDDFDDFDDNGFDILDLEEQQKQKESIEKSMLVNNLINKKYIDLDTTEIIVNSEWNEDNVDPSYTIDQLFCDTLYSTDLISILKRLDINLDSSFIPFFSDKETSVKRLIDKGYINVNGFDVNKTNVMYVPPISSGVVYEMTKWGYNSTIMPVLEVSLSTTIGFISGIVGKMWQLPTNAGLNNYIVLIAQSGVGKDGLHSIKDELLVELEEIARQKNIMYGDIKGHILSNDFMSASALYKDLATMVKPKDDEMTYEKMVSVVNYNKEFGDKLSMICTAKDNGASTLKKAYLELYTGSSVSSIMGGLSYSDKEKNTGNVKAPSFSLVGETTTENFKEFLNPKSAQDGFLSRLTTITYTGEQVRRNMNAKNFKPPLRMMETISNMIAQESILSGSTGGKPRFVTIKIDEKAQEFDQKIDDLVYYLLTEIKEKEYIRQAWSRTLLKIEKLAGICAVSQNYFNPIINLHHIAWATRVVFNEIGLMFKYILNGETNILDNASKTCDDLIIKTCYEFLTDTVINLSKKCANLGTFKITALKQKQIIPIAYLRAVLNDNKSFRDNFGKSNLLYCINNLIIDGSLDKISNEKAKTITNGVYRGECYKINIELDLLKERYQK